MCIGSQIYSNQHLQVSYFSGQASIHYFLRQCLFARGRKSHFKISGFKELLLKGNLKTYCLLFPQPDPDRREVKIPEW